MNNEHVKKEGSQGTKVIIAAAAAATTILIRHVWGSIRPEREDEVACQTATWKFLTTATT